MNQYGEEVTEPPTWYFKSEGLWGSLGLRIVPAERIDVSPLLIGLLHFISQWGALGAKSQVGFGVVQLETVADPLPLYTYLALVENSVPPDHYGAWPNLSQMFFAQFTPGRTDRVALAELKTELRALFRPDDGVRHTLLGTITGSRRASLVKVSAPYGDPAQMRVWGWVPDAAWRVNAVREIHTHLHTLDSGLTWQELGSTRDPAHHHATALAFAADLLGVTP
jgi:CRISPR-associated protein Cmr1